MLCVSCLKEIVTMYPAKAELYEYYIESLEESTQRVPASSTNLKEYSKNRILIMLLKDYLGSYVKTYSRYEPFIKKIRPPHLGRCLVKKFHFRDKSRKSLLAEQAQNVLSALVCLSNHCCSGLGQNLVLCKVYHFFSHICITDA